MKEFEVCIPGGTKSLGRGSWVTTSGCLLTVSRDKALEFLILNPDAFVTECGTVHSYHNGVTGTLDGFSDDAKEIKELAKECRDIVERAKANSFIKRIFSLIRRVRSD